MRPRIIPPGIVPSPFAQVLNRADRHREKKMNAHPPPGMTPRWTFGGRSRRAPALAGFLASLALHLVPGPAAAGTISIVALSGRPAPAGGNYSSFTAPVINTSWEVAFSAT